MSKAMTQSSVDAESDNAVVLALSIITCVAAFLVVYGVWSL
jgi:hypothetical protein